MFWISRDVMVEVLLSMSNTRPTRQLTIDRTDRETRHLSTCYILQ